MKDLKNIIKNLWYQKYDKIKIFNEYWLNESSLRNFSTENLENFQNLKDLHFCTSKIDDIDEAMFSSSKNLNMLEYQKLVEIGDSEIGYDENQRKILSSREKKISGWVTANHTFFLTFLSTYFEQKVANEVCDALNFKRLAVILMNNY